MTQSVDPKFEHVADRDDLNIGGGVQDIVGRPGAPAPAADQADFDDVVAGRMHVGQQAQVRRQGAAGHGSGLEKFPTARVLLAHELSLRMETDRCKAQAKPTDGSPWA